MATQLTCCYLPAGDWSEVAGALKQLRNLNDNKAAGLDGIPP